MNYSAYNSSNNLAPSCTLFALFSMRYISNYKQIQHIQQHSVSKKYKIFLSAMVTLKGSSH